jgi:large subunit ribosomal protein L4
MLEIPVYNSDGKQVDSLLVDEQKLGGEVRPALLKQAYVRYHANRRQGSARTRSRGMVEGSTKKLFKQKGTGNARRGPIRTNIMRGGGVAFAKKEKSWRLEMPHKMRRLANRNAVLAKAVDEEIKLVDTLAPGDDAKTKHFAALLKTLRIDRTCLLAVADTSGPIARAARNISDITVILVDQLNAFDLLNHRYLLAEKDAFKDWLDRATNGQQRPAPAPSQAEPAAQGGE